MLINNETPVEDIEREEYFGLLLDFCTFVCILRNKKMNFPSIFVEVLKDRAILDAYLEFCGFTDERDGLREFMRVDESITRSKFVKKYINQNGT